MKRTVCALLAAAVCVVAFSLPVYGGHWGGSIWIGPGWAGPVWGPVYPYPYYGYYGWPPTVVERPVIIRESPPVYVERSPNVDDESYWYYCPKPEGYYPYVKKCPKGWLKVVPSPEPADEEE